MRSSNGASHDVVGIASIGVNDDKRYLRWTISNDVLHLSERDHAVDIRLGGESLSSAISLDFLKGHLKM
jgi:hypothetical protein